MQPGLIFLHKERLGRGSAEVTAQVLGPDL